MTALLEPTRSDRRDSGRSRRASSKQTGFLRFTPSTPSTARLTSLAEFRHRCVFCNKHHYLLPPQDAHNTKCPCGGRLAPSADAPPPEPQSECCSCRVCGRETFVFPPRTIETEACMFCGGALRKQRGQAPLDARVGLSPTDRHVCWTPEISEPEVKVWRKHVRRWKPSRARRRIGRVLAVLFAAWLMALAHGQPTARIGTPAVAAPAPALTSP